MDRITWCDRVCAHVRFRPDHKAIRKELRAHMEDVRWDLVDAGLKSTDAEERMLERMGDPDEVGRLLDRVHSPLLGWLWQISRVLVILCLGVTLAAALAIFSPEDLSGVSFSGGWRVRGCGAYTDGYYIAVTEGALWENGDANDGRGEVKLALRVWDLLGSGESRVLPEGFCAALDGGERYESLLSGEEDGPFLRIDRSCLRPFSHVYALTVPDVPLDAEWIELRFSQNGRELCLRVELPGEVRE